jgi:superoxide dismutase
MEIHHSKHHNTYVTNFNAAMEQYADAEARGDYAAMIALQVGSFSTSCCLLLVCIDVPFLPLLL